MAVTQLIEVGIVTSIAQNTIFALPARKCFIMAQAAVEISLDGSTFVTATGSNTTGVATVAPFVRCTTGATIIVADPDS